MVEFGGRPGLAQVYLDVARIFSNPTLFGPPLCDELVALVEHMFTEEEANIVRNMKPLRPHTAAGLAKAAGVSKEEASRLLGHMANDKHVLFSLGKGALARYTIPPIIPGIFEDIMLSLEEEKATPWHRRFAELFQELFSTGFITDYIKRPINPVRYLPIGEVIEDLPMAYPSDRLETVLDRYSDFAIGHCQCRLSKKLLDEDCGRMIDTCTFIGSIAPLVAKSGRAKMASKQDVLDVKRAAEKEGLVTWGMNSGSAMGTICCSCCGCCCASLRTISEFSQPGFIAPPHFMPETDLSKCQNSGDCVLACPMGALVPMGEGPAGWIEHKPERCIGCGLCVAACCNGAKSLRDLPDYRKPPATVPGYVARYAFNAMRNPLTIRRTRKRGGGTGSGKD